MCPRWVRVRPRIQAPFSGRGADGFHRIYRLARMTGLQRRCSGDPEPNTTDYAGTQTGETYLERFIHSTAVETGSGGAYTKA